MARKKIRTSISRISLPLLGHDVFTQVPPEIFIKICSYLHPKDLASLNVVCRLFNNYLSSTETSSNVIWMDSKQNMLPPIDISPPEGMDERHFLMSIYGKWCQKCWKKERKTNSVKWEFPLQCCAQCRNSIVKSYEDFTNNVIPILRALPSAIHIPDKRLTKIRIELQYWAPQVQGVYREYSRLKTIELKRKFLQSLKEQSRKKEIEIAKYTSWQEEYKKKCENFKIQAIENRRNAIISRVYEMMNERYDDDGKEFKWQWKTLNDLNAYKNAIKSKSTAPFTEKAWKLLRRKIESAHYINMKM
ncbi:13240_t:CDS:2 [Ambispora leptoticha]|uniref:13240_t:CDS:1 n=1 Tax=Ambispora leptoticha TaxID=144679 RepID=A0A9N9D7Y2_9GLOM|nr:13240_t:CDS:2 [Ambispora leptoticha]